MKRKDDEKQQGSTSCKIVMQKTEETDKELANYEKVKIRRLSGRHLRKTSQIKTKHRRVRTINYWVR